MRRYHKQYNYAQFFEPRRKRNWGAVVGGLASGLVGGLFGGDEKKSSTSSNAYQPKYSKQIDQMVYNLIQQQQGMANPYTANGNQFDALLNSLIGNYQNLQGGDYSTYLNKQLTGAFNPELDDVYQNLLRNTQQGTRSAATARGLNTSPYGAGLENEAVRQMNLAWAQDAQNRQQQALQSYLSGQTGLASLGTNALDTATKLEGLKKGWNQTDISNMLNYIGRAGQGTSQTTTQTGNNMGSALQSVVGEIDWGNMFGGNTGTPSVYDYLGNTADYMPGIY